MVARLLDAPSGPSVRGASFVQVAGSAADPACVAAIDDVPLDIGGAVITLGQAFSGGDIEPLTLSGPCSDVSGFCSGADVLTASAGSCTAAASCCQVGNLTVRRAPLCCKNARPQSITIHLFSPLRAVSLKQSALSPAAAEARRRGWPEVPPLHVSAVTLCASLGVGRQNLVH